MAQFTPSKKTINDFNDGEEYLNRIDVVQADTINNLVEGLLYAQEHGESGGDKFVTLDTEQTITGKKTFTTLVTGSSEGFITSSVGEGLNRRIDRATLLPSSISYSHRPNRTGATETTYTLSFPPRDGTFVVDTDLENYVTTDTLNGYAKLDGSNTFSGTNEFYDTVEFNGDVHFRNRTLLVNSEETQSTEDVLLPSRSGTIALTDDIITSTATQSANGLMSSTDKTHLDSMWNIWSSDGTTDTLVNKVQEVLSAFESFKEGDTIVDLLSKKADASSLSNYVTLNTSQNISGIKTFGDDTLHVTDSADYQHIYTSYNMGNIERSLDQITSYQYGFPDKSGTFALTSDITYTAGDGISISDTKIISSKTKIETINDELYAQEEAQYDLSNYENCYLSAIISVEGSITDFYYISQVNPVRYTLFGTSEKKASTWTQLKIWKRGNYIYGGFYRWDGFYLPISFTVSHMGIDILVRDAESSSYGLVIRGEIVVY